MVSLSTPSDPACSIRQHRRIVRAHVWSDLDSGANPVVADHGVGQAALVLFEVRPSRGQDDRDAVVVGDVPVVCARRRRRGLGRSRRGAWWAGRRMAEHQCDRDRSGDHECGDRCCDRGPWQAPGPRLRCGCEPELLDVLGGVDASDSFIRDRELVLQPGDPSFAAAGPKPGGNSHGGSVALLDAPIHWSRVESPLSVRPTRRPRLPADAAPGAPGSSSGRTISPPLPARDRARHGQDRGRRGAPMVAVAGARLGIVGGVHPIAEATGEMRSMPQGCRRDARSNGLVTCAGRRTRSPACRSSRTCCRRREW